jgi:hypothetical protein
MVIYVPDPLKCAMLKHAKMENELKLCSVKLLIKKKLCSVKFELIKLVQLLSMLIIYIYIYIYIYILFRSLLYFPSTIGC